MKCKESLKGEYFTDYDDNTGLWCVFHTDFRTGHAFSNWSDKRQAEQDAEKRNNR